MHAFRTFALVAPFALAVGCASSESAKKPASAAPKNESAPVAKAPAAEQPLAGTVARAKPSTDPLYFNYDAHLLESDAQKRLTEIAAYLKETPGATVRISGHADERGTNEYNLALGDARARAAHEYLVKLGVSPDRIKFETLGEERPAVEGSTEDAWSKNRRDEIKLEG
jgi:peptidoglycan-associated lipoprotein